MRIVGTLCEGSSKLPRNIVCIATGSKVRGLTHGRGACSACPKIIALRANGTLYRHVKEGFR